MSDAIGIPPPPPAEGVVLVCQTCPRPAEQHQVKRAPGSGVQLADRLTAELALLGAVIQVTRVDCLSRCQYPCNVRLAGRRKRGFEFTQVQPEDARTLAAFAHSYSKSDTGSVPDDDIPPTLRTQAR